MWKAVMKAFLSAYTEEQFDLLEKFTPYPEIWAPYYTLHKILAGLIDCYEQIHLDTALHMAEKLGDWV
ncbi:MAG: beta-L-arabinofuranosidase domain-containing protein [[Clostridium] innocuum]